MNIFRTLLVGAVVSMATLTVHAAGDAKNGATLFRQCLACHSLEPGRHLTGPSLAGVVGKRAGTAQGFGRYSDVMKAAAVMWTEETLDAWLESPTEFIPGTSMRIDGVAERQARQDLIAFLKTVGAEGGKVESKIGSGMMGGMMGRPMVDLKELTPAQQVTALRYCDDAYYVTIAAGGTFTFWEFNLRFKTDSSELGPEKGKPAILRASMRGDRAFVIFSDPTEISAFIQKQC
jgi:cytochrome c